MSQPEALLKDIFGQGYFQWLIHQPMELILLMIVGGGLVFIVGGVLLANNYMTAEELISNTLVGTFKFMFLAQIFTGVIAFIMVEAGNRYANAEAYVDAEVRGLRLLTKTVSRMPLENQTRFHDAMKEYAKSVAETEWPMMVTGDDSPVSRAAFRRMLGVYFSFNPTDTADRSVVALGNLAVAMVVEARTNRLNNNVSKEFSDFIWVSLLGLVIITAMFNWFFGTRSLLSQVVMGISLGASILTCIFLVFLLSNPFAGDAAIRPTPFLELAE
ncbi:MAG: DUF4239 domain-containing protein [Alphaproteobacteria bacterium]|nr:DUF4239 domain-containing protein [Alphaproteobacteria bacterium]